jgi:integrase/recombinase XerD
MNISIQLKSLEEELRRKCYRENSINNYLSYCSVFLEKHRYKDSAKHVSEQDIKDFLRGFSEHNTQRAYHSAIKVFYRYVVKQPNKFKYIEYCKRSRRLPVVLSEDDVRKIFRECYNLKHKSILYLLYSCGLRVGEITNMKIADIDSARMVIYIKDAKGGKDRQVPLHGKVLEILREYYKKYKPSVYLFNGQTAEKYSEQSIRQFISTYSERAKIGKRVYPHLFRHSCFTNMIENGNDISVVQKIAGHSSVSVTQIYTHISSTLINKVYNPISSV